MKKIILPLLMPSLLFIACKKSDPVEKTTSSAHYISATTSSGKSFIDSSMQCKGATGKKVTIGATNTNGIFDLWLLTYTATPGTYSLDAVNQGSSLSSSTSDTMSLSAHGTLTITGTSPDLKGSFVYTQRDSVVVTGSFNVPKPD